MLGEGGCRNSISFILVHANKGEAKNKEEASLKQGLSTQGKTSRMGFKAGNLLPWQRGEHSHCQAQADQKCLPHVIVFSETSHGPGSLPSGGWTLLFPERQGLRCLMDQKPSLPIHASLPAMVPGNPKPLP